MMTNNNKFYVAGLLTSAGVMTLTNAAIGQDQASGQQDQLEEIVVTGTRLRASGFEAPTPVTIVDMESLHQSNSTNVVNAIQEVPQFIGSQNFESGGKAGIGSGRGQFLDLRNFGAHRTLVLLDGVRMSPTTYTGQVNSEIIPQMLLERVDVVTAGASAAYGSDAVAGAVNYIIDHDYTGYKVESSAGISRHGDSFDYRAGIAGGLEVGDRGHLLFSLERFDTDGIQMFERPPVGLESYIAAGKTPGGGPPGTSGNPYVIYSNAQWIILSAGGHVLSGPLAGTYFPRPGEFTFFNFGTPTGSGATAVGSDGVALQVDQTITEDANSNQAYMRFSYDTENIRTYISGLYSIADVEVKAGFNYFDFGHQVFSGNPFIPAALQAQMTAQGIQSFFVNKYVTDSPLSPAIDDTSHYTIRAGLEGDLGAKYTWNFDLSHGFTNQLAQEINTPELRKFHAAADAVIDPATGNTVCRVSLTNPGLYPGCVPFNILGENAASQEAVDYIHGTSRYATDTILSQFTASIQGDLFTLPAGPVSVAVGTEYREQELRMKSNSDPAVVRPVTGLRSMVESQPRYWFANRASAVAKLDVTELFGEVAVPVFKSLAVNGAARHTDYSTSGEVTTWKAGGTWRPIDDFLFRVTRSRDIRAPTLFDLGQSGAAGRSTLNDPLTGVGAVVLTAGGGNPNLVPEEADTTTFGVVYSPSYAPGLNIAIDFFDLDLGGAIATLGAQNVVNQCFFSGGVDPICAQVERPISPTDTSPANFPTLIRTGPTNSSFINTKGFDFEASYSTDIGAGTFTGRLLLTHINEYQTQASPFLPIVEEAGTDLMPDLKALLKVEYTRGPFSLFLQERIIGEITLGQQPNRIWDEPPVSAYYYTDVTAAYELQRGDSTFDFFLTVRNLFDKEPPLVPNTAAPRFNFPTLTWYDIIGTTFTLGMRASF